MAKNDRVGKILSGLKKVTGSKWFWIILLAFCAVIVAIIFLKDMALYILGLFGVGITALKGREIIKKNKEKIKESQYKEQKIIDEMELDIEENNNMSLDDLVDDFNKRKR